MWSVAIRWQVCDASQVVGLIWSVTFSKGYIFESSNHICNSFLLKTFQFWAPYHIDLTECLHSTAHNISNFGVSNDLSQCSGSEGKWKNLIHNGASFTLHLQMMLNGNLFWNASISHTLTTIFIWVCVSMSKDRQVKVPCVPCHWQSWYWLCKLNESLYSCRNHFNYLCNIGVDQW